MPSLITSVAVEECLRACLSREGYKLNMVRRHGETGVDIEACKGPFMAAIEVIGYHSSGSTRARDFFQAFFRTVSRLNDGAARCVLAVPARFSAGLPTRANQHRVAWKRIAKAFPELEIWPVDTERQSYERTKWGNWVEGKRSLAAAAP
jgi:hypothetical protein